MSSTAWGLQARPSYLVISNDRFVAGGTGSSYKLPLWIRDQWAYSKIEEYKYYWKIIDYPKLIFQKKLVTVKELADILEVKEGTLAFYIMHGCTRYKDFTWDFDFQEYHSRCQQWEDDKVEREALEEEEKARKRAAFHAIIKEKKAKYKQTNQEINEVKKVWAQGKLEKLKETVAWTIRSQEIQGIWRVYLDGVISNKETVAKLFKWSDSLISAMCKIGDFEYQGHKVQLRNPPKKTPYEVKSPRVLLTKEEKLERARVLERKRRERNWLVNPPKQRQNRYNVKKVDVDFTLIPYAEKVNSKASALHLNGEKMRSEKIAELTGLTQRFIHDKAPDGIILYNGFRIELKKYQRSNWDCPPPAIKKSGKNWKVCISWRGNRWKWYEGVHLDTAEQILAEILINDKWKEKVGIDTIQNIV